jgi:single-stranded DNA-binding protein
VIDALIAGRLYGTPTERETKHGKAFATGKARVSTASGETVFVNLIAFAESAVASLLALNDGDAVALAGELTPKAWTDREGQAKPSLDMVVHAILTAYHVSRKRQAMAEVSDEETAA